MPNWVVTGYGKLKTIEAEPLKEHEIEQLSPILKALAAEPISTHDLVVGLKGAFPEWREQLDGDQIDALCRQLSGQGELREL